jgi:hypothetical protein
MRGAVLAASIAAGANEARPVRSPMTEVHQLEVLKAGTSGPSPGASPTPLSRFASPLGVALVEGHPFPHEINQNLSVFNIYASTARDVTPRVTIA